MNNQKIISREEWLEIRKAHLEKEKAFTLQKDQLSRDRRELPWVRVEKEYVFDGPNGKETLEQLFEGRSQLIVYHFMFGPNEKEGCKSCSFWADNFNGAIVHLNHRDITMIAVSKAGLSTLEEYKKRMGWRFKWVSSFSNDFNRDYKVSFTKEEIEKGEKLYNFGTVEAPHDEAHGISVFYKNEQGEVFHTYSTYSRGLDMVNSAYQYMDLVPKGRGNEEDLSYSMAWVQRHDSYNY
ncbi:DUF899 domain-containing protein [Chengkuizengella sediminis]|uniref:DUF899 domain-containing protein n=1 Tax=Chengkuizengella sediminis TaxID=1885917 RepID=UPI001389C39E|nr:thioredoxin family protein [Chengkuizengella sediminis]NDI33270.1 DUF899 domain-containing protein [Chengkuizengella sediminis]